MTDIRKGEGRVEMNARLWIVEVWHVDRHQWTPTRGARLCRAEARDECRLWAFNNPDHRFRVRGYVREESR